MFKEALTIMVLGMGTVFMVLIALLILVTVGGRIAHCLLQKSAAKESDDTAASDTERDVAMAVAAAWTRKPDGKNDKN